MPAIKYPRKMSQKSKTSFLLMKLEDPASNSGIISIFKVQITTYHKTNIKLQDCVPYLPTVRGRKQKTAMFGDQLFCERGKVECIITLINIPISNDALHLMTSPKRAFPSLCIIMHEKEK